MRTFIFKPRVMSLKHRLLYFIRGFASILDGIILITSFGFLCSCFDLRIAEYTLIEAAKEAKRRRLALKQS